jgi:hypothetical protein
MTQKDYLDLPDRIDNNHIIAMDEPLHYLYKAFKADMVLELKKQEQQITAVNAGVLAGKLLQFCGGSIYNNEGISQTIHQLKLDKLEDIIEQANGNPVLVYYAFIHEANSIKERFKSMVTDIKSPGAIDKWNKGKVPLLLAHPASAGQGLNLQHGGNIIAWYNLTYDLELYQQANKRLHRMGQGKPVYVNHILIKGGMDETILNTVLAKKGKLMDSVMASLS